MNEEIAYAEMLEIPVSTIRVEHKKRRKKAAKKVRAQQAQIPQMPPLQGGWLKDSVIEKVNEKLAVGAGETLTAEANLFAESANSRGEIDFSPLPERIDTVRLYSAVKTGKNGVQPVYAYGDEGQEDMGRYEMTEEDISESAPIESAADRRTRIALNIEFIAACALCGAIFLTNVFMPGSAINTFFQSLAQTPAKTDDRAYTDFVLSGVVNDFSSTTLTLSPTGVLTFQDECCVYPVADGTVSEVLRSTDGKYTLKIAYSTQFSGVYEGLDCVYYEVGDSVKANIPVAFSKGENEVQVTMYAEGELLNCFEITEENCLAWITDSPTPDTPTGGAAGSDTVE